MTLLHLLATAAKDASEMDGLTLFKTHRLGSAPLPREMLTPENAARQWTQTVLQPMIPLAPTTLPQDGVHPQASSQTWT